MTDPDNNLIVGKTYLDGEPVDTADLSPMPDDVADLERQIAALERWRAEALGVIHDWRAVEVKVPGWFRAARLGQPWPHIVAEWIDHLRALVNPEALAGEGS